MRIVVLCALALAACGANDDRLTDEQAGVAQNIALDAPVAIDQPAASPANPSAATYRAVGTEPGWALTINGGSMEYLGDYGSVTIREATPANFRSRPGRYNGSRLTLTISPGPCSDGMSDLVYRQTVRLIADGKAVSGCGRGTVAPDQLAGTSWIVTAINGRATPANKGYFVNFTGSTISASFGCNTIGGGFRVNGDHLSITELIQTELGCPEPAVTFERLGSAVLNSNMRVERSSGERMRLVSEAGSIDLRRAN
ncbi:MAG: META domain-containing protein [Sphingomonas bacterium]|nr:META domain-containing protein [Sphingomonas bacterium]